MYWVPGNYLVPGIPSYTFQNLDIPNTRTRTLILLPWVTGARYFSVPGTFSVIACLLRNTLPQPSSTVDVLQVEEE